jgi:fucokinase
VSHPSHKRKPDRNRTRTTTRTRDRTRKDATALTVALDANAAAYRHAVQAGGPGECWDYLVLTAANEKQAEGYRQELALRHRAAGPAGAFFPQVQRSVVVADPPGHKAGSGGATLGAVRALATQFDLDPSDFDRLRILLLHSGGMSQRMPMYSALGKIFSPLPLLRPDGQIATLFDHLYVTLAGLPERLGPGMLVLAGDVFLLFDHRHVTAPPPGVTAISMRVGAELGRGHGVFVTGDGAGNSDRQIVQTLQKVSLDEMKQRGATDAAGKVLIDTGLLFFDPERMRTLSDLSRTIRAQTEIDLYDDMTAALAAGTDEHSYLRTGRSRTVRRRLWRDLHGVPFNVLEVAGEFLHLGTTRQFRDAMVGRDASPAAALFQRNVLARVPAARGTGARAFQSIIADDRSSLGRDCVVEHSVLEGPCRIGAGSVVSQVSCQDEKVRLDVPPDLLLFQVPTRPEHRKANPLPLIAHVVCGVNDDMKGRLAEGRCTYLNRPIEAWLRRRGLTPEDLWRGVPASERTLWNARIFIASQYGQDVADALAAAAPRPGSGALARWRRYPRVSMSDILRTVDASELVARRESVAGRLQALAVLEVIRSGQDLPTEPMIGHFSTHLGYLGALLCLAGHLRDKPRDPRGLLDLARALWTSAQVARRPQFPGPRHEQTATMDWAFKCVADASEAGSRAARAGGAARRTNIAAAPRTTGRLRPGVEVVATAPARLDLAGGWTDTPPYCFERGGHVVNVGIDLDGRPPVMATVSTLKDLVLIVESHDLGRKIELSDADAGKWVDVNDPFALHKVALRTAGLLAEGIPLRKQLRRLGAGLHVTTEARVPKGSGLGTSSILAATLLAALHAAAGRKSSPRQLIEQTLILEQRLSTGGGWQDQVGGVAPGVKSTVSAPGIPQEPKVEVLNMPGPLLDALQDRLVVYYSGRQRLARDILRRVMGRWLAREPAVIGLMDSLKASAAALRAALLRGNWRAAAGEVNRYWQIKKDLYPGSTTPAIDLLFLETRDDYLAAGMAGAGGGGFAYFLCKDTRQAARLRARLAERSAQPGSMGSVYATQINREGLRVRRRRV